MVTFLFLAQSVNTQIVKRSYETLEFTTLQCISLSVLRIVIYNTTIDFYIKLKSLQYSVSMAKYQE